MSKNKQLDATDYSSLNEQTDSAEVGSIGKEVHVRNFTKIYGGDVLAVNDISFDVNSGELFVIIGPSGCGKTTVLHSILGALKPTEGEIIIDENNVINLPIYKRDIGLVFQHFVLFPHLSVEENIEFGLRRLQVPENERTERTSQVLDLIGIANLRDRMPADLSLGEKQSAALARSIVLDPAVLLLDEPLGDLDFRKKKELELKLKLLQDNLTLTIVHVTHDQTQAMRLADRVMVMNNGQVEQIGTPEDIYHSPETAFVANFIGDANILIGEAAELDDHTNHVEVRTDIGNFRSDVDDPTYERLMSTIDKQVSLVLRPEHVSFCEQTENMTNTLSGEVIDIIESDRGFTVYIQSASKEIQLFSERNPSVKVGDKTLVGWNENTGTLLDRVSVVDGVDLEKDVLGE